MFTIAADTLNLSVVWVMLMSLRLLGCFLTMPLFAFRAVPLRWRVGLTLFLAITLAPVLQMQPPPSVIQAGYFSAFIELAIGMTAGWLMRVGFAAIDLLAEVLSVQTGLSFAATYNQDPNLASGVTGEFLGMIALALAFTLNVHLIFLDVMLRSFETMPLGQWPAAWSIDGVLVLIQHAFSVGLLLALPAIVVFFMFNLTQAILARVSPQMNLFSVGFSIMVPVAFVVIALIAPALPDMVERALEVPMELIRGGLLVK